MTDFLVWEIRTCSFLVAVGVPTYAVSKSIGFVVAALAMAIVIGIDTYLSVGITKLFVRPISKVLAEGSGVANGSAGYKRMLQSKWWTLLGSTLAVASSTILYVMIVLQLLWGGPDGEMWRNEWLNVFVLGVNMNSILKTVGMVFVCGMLKRTLSAQPPISSGPGPAAVARKTEFQANSKASSNYSPSELQQSVMPTEEEGPQKLAAPISHFSTTPFSELQQSAVHAEEEGPQKLLAPIHHFTTTPFNSFGLPAYSRSGGHSSTYNRPSAEQI
jgi:hypothetical protein